MKDKVVVFTAYNRDDYLKETLDKWSNVRGLDKYDFYFRIEPSDKTEIITDLIHDFKSKVNTDVFTIHNYQLLGCAMNTWTAFNDLFQKYDFVILAEDDITPSDDVLEYFTFLERKYKSDPEVASISANFEFEGYDRHSVSKIDTFRGQIWGTWKDRWENYIRDTWDFAYNTSVNGGPAGWDWNLSLRVLPKNKLKCVVPHASRSQHIGVNGIHCDQTVFDGTQMKSFRFERPWKDLVEV